MLSIRSITASPSISSRAKGPAVVRIRSRYCLYARLPSAHVRLYSRQNESYHLDVVAMLNVHWDTQTTQRDAKRKTRACKERSQRKGARCGRCCDVVLKLTSGVVRGLLQGERWCGRGTLKLLVAPLQGLLQHYAQPCVCYRFWKPLLTVTFTTLPKSRQMLKVTECKSAELIPNF